MRDLVHDPAEQLFARPAEELLGRLVHVADATFRVEREQAVTEAVGNGLEVVARGAQRALGLQALGQVDGHAYPPGGPRSSVEHEPRAQVRGEPRAVLVADRVLALPVPAAAELGDRIGRGARRRAGRGTPWRRGRAPRPCDQPYSHSAPRLKCVIPPGGIRGHDRHVDLLEQRRLCRDLLLGELLLGDVLGRAADAHERPVGVADHPPARLEPCIRVRVGMAHHPRVALPAHDRQELLTRCGLLIGRHRREQAVGRPHGPRLHVHIVQRVEEQHLAGLGPPLPGRQARDRVRLGRRSWLVTRRPCSPSCAVTSRKEIARPLTAPASSRNG